MSLFSGLEKKFFGGHPRGLPLLFMSEFWERFSFYGMRALLVLYMIKAMKDPSTGAVFSRPDAYEVYGAYGAMVYAFPVLGGYMADKILGYRRAIALGGILMAIGHFLMAVEDPYVFFLALSFLCVGNGFFKPNISSSVGALYEPGDPRRDSGFTIFYMGINFGALIAPLVCGTIGEKFSFHWGFSLAGFGMLLGLWMFLKGQDRLEGHGESRHPERLAGRTMGLKNLHLVVIGAFLVTPLVALLLMQNAIMTTLLSILGVCILGVLIYTAAKAPKIWSQRLTVLIVLMFFHIMFWAFFEQAGSSLTTLADKHVDRVLFDEPMAKSQIGEKLSDFTITQAHLGKQFKNVEITADHVGEEADDGTTFSGFTITQPFVGTTFNGVGVEFQYGGQLWKDRTISEDDIGKTFGEIEVTKVTEGDDGKYTEAGKASLGSLVTGPGPFADALRNLKIERKHRKSVLTAIGQGPSFSKVTMTPNHLGVPIEIAQVNQEHKGKIFEAITASGKDADGGKVLASVTLDESHVGMGLNGFAATASQFQAVNPLFIVLLAPLFSALWLTLKRKKRDPSTPMKFAIALFFVGGGFYVLRMSYDSQTAGMIAAGWLVFSYLLQTIGELCLSPVGLSAVTRLAPPKIVGFAMGAWFLTIAFAHHFAAIIAKLTSGGGDGVSKASNPVADLKAYTDVFQIVAISAAGAGVLLILLTPWLKKWMHEDEVAPDY